MTSGTGVLPVTLAGTDRMNVRAVPSTITVRVVSPGSNMLAAGQGSWPLDPAPAGAGVAPAAGTPAADAGAAAAETPAAALPLPAALPDTPEVDGASERDPAVPGPAPAVAVPGIAVAPASGLATVVPTMGGVACAPAFSFGGSSEQARNKPVVIKARARVET